MSLGLLNAMTMSANTAIGMLAAYKALVRRMQWEVNALCGTACAGGESLPASRTLPDTGQSLSEGQMREEPLAEALDALDAEMDRVFREAMAAPYGSHKEAAAKRRLLQLAEICDMQMEG